jgi:hypothetical protein
VLVLVVVIVIVIVVVVVVVVEDIENTIMCQHKKSIEKRKRSFDATCVISLVDYDYDYDYDYEHDYEHDRRHKILGFSTIRCVCPGIVRDSPLKAASECVRNSLT